MPKPEQPPGPSQSRRPNPPAKPSEQPYVKVYQDEAGEWRWTRRARNGEALAASTEGYEDRAYALERAEADNPAGTEIILDDYSDQA